MKGRDFVKQMMKAAIMTVVSVGVLWSMPGEMGKQTGIVMEALAAQGQTSGTLDMTTCTEDIELTLISEAGLTFDPGNSSFQGLGITVKSWVSSSSSVDNSNLWGKTVSTSTDANYWYSYDATNKALNIYSIQNECSTSLGNSETYTTPQFITLRGTCDRIYYTTDGSEPTTSSAYVGKGKDIGISHSCILKMMPVYIVGQDMVRGTVTSISYSMNVPSDIADVERVIYPADRTTSIPLTWVDSYGVQVAAKGKNFTADGITVKQWSDSTTCTSGDNYGSITDSSDSKSYFWYSYDAANKIVNLYYITNSCSIDLDAGQSYTGPQIVTVNGNCDRIYYTKDGSEPTTSSAYTAAGRDITLSSSCTVKMLPVYTVGADVIKGKVTSAKYTVNTPAGVSLAERVIYPLNCTADISLTRVDEYGIELAARNNSFKTDGITVNQWGGLATPTSGDGYIAIIDYSTSETTCWYSYRAASKTVNIYGVNNACTTKPDGSQSYTSPQQVQVDGTCSRIYYTTDGSEPTVNSSYVIPGSTVTISSSCKLKMLPAIVNGTEIATGNVTTVSYTIGNPGGGSTDDDDDDEDDTDDEEDDTDDEDNTDVDDDEDNGGGSVEDNWIFTDVPKIPGHWQYEAVKYVYERGIMNGVSATLFAPNGKLDRAMFATVLYRMAGSPQVEFQNKFTDVKSGTYYSNAVIWVSEQGIAVGFGDGSYGAKSNITREQIAKMLYGYAVSQGYDVSGSASLDGFTDKDNVSGWAVNYMKWAVDTGMINGKIAADGSLYLDPKGDATRAECAKMLSMFLKKYAPDK